MVLDASLFYTQHYKVRIKVKVEQSRERSSAPLHLDVVAIEKGAFESPSTMVANFTFTITIKYILIITINKFHIMTSTAESKHVLKNLKLH